MTSKELKQATEMYVSLTKKRDELIDFLKRNKNIPMPKMIEIKKNADKLITNIENIKEKMIVLAACADLNDFTEWHEMIKPYIKTEKENEK